MNYIFIKTTFIFCSSMMMMVQVRHCGVVGISDTLYYPSLSCLHQKVCAL